MAEINNNPIPIRAHHVEAALKLLPLSQEEASGILRKAGYPLQFIDFFYKDIKNLFSNPEQKFLVTLDEPDFICNYCKSSSDRYKQEGCFLSGDERTAFLRAKAKPFIGSAFSEGIERSMNDDKAAINKYGLNVGQVYRVREFRERVEL